MGSNLLAKASIKKALEEDPNIFEYDEVYDEIKKDDKSKDEDKSSGGQKKQSKYIQSLLKTAERRTREQERRIIRKAQREIENDKDEYGETEIFITAAYREKLREMKELEEKEKLEIALEEAMDVKKQKDLSGFYKYFLNNTLSADKGKNKSSSDANKQPSKRSTNVSQEKLSFDESTESEMISNEIAGDAEKEEEQAANIASDDKKKEDIKEGENESEIKVSKEERLKKVFEKRTIGEVFIAAVEKYKERQRLSSVC